MLLNWEAKITDLCEKFGVDPESYNDSDDFKEMIASFFGFSSYDSFDAFPNPKDIIDGRGNNLQQEHMVLSLALVQDCCELIRHRYLFDRDQAVLDQQITNLLDYIDENLSNEYHEAAKVIVNQTEFKA